MISALVLDLPGALPPDSPSDRREFLAWLATSSDLFEVIDQPSLAEAPVGPNRLVIAMFGLIAGIAGGALLWRRPPPAAPPAVVQPAG
jgi:hypothetical protein